MEAIPKTKTSKDEEDYRKEVVQNTLPILVDLAQKYNLYFSKQKTSFICFTSAWNLWEQASKGMSPESWSVIKL